MNKVVLLSFADKRYYRSLSRLKIDTESFRFDQCYFLSEKNLDKEFLRQINPQLYRRGFGYWAWKPYLIYKIFQTLDDGDILFYTDAGTYWNMHGQKRFYEYLEMLNHETSGILAFQQPFLEKDWTKGDVFYKLDALDDGIVMSLQLWGGTFALKKCSNSESFVSEWYNLCRKNFSLFTDEESNYPNYIGFQEHRHDQSLFSVLVKKRPHIEISWKEVVSLDCSNWDDLDTFPIQARRLKEKDRRFKEKLLWKLSVPYRFFIGLYLNNFKRFHFANKIDW